MARNYRSNGKPNGGKREGAGRPSGSTNSLEYGEVRAVKAAGLRVPEAATPEQRELADEALGVIVELMRGEVRKRKRPKNDDVEVIPVPLDLRGRMAVRVREEVCGELKQTVRVEGLEQLTDEQLQARLASLLANNFPQQAAPTDSTVPREGAGPGLEGDSP